jgi:hypothetical protein
MYKEIFRNKMLIVMIGLVVCCGTSQAETTAENQETQSTGSPLSANQGGQVDPDFDVSGILPKGGPEFPEIASAHKQRKENVQAAWKKIDEDFKKSHPEATEQEINNHRSAVQLAYNNFVGAKTEKWSSLGSYQGGQLGGASDTEGVMLKFAYDYFKSHPDELSQLVKMIFLSGDFNFDFLALSYRDRDNAAALQTQDKINLDRYNSQLKLLNKYFEEQDKKN